MAEDNVCDHELIEWREKILKDFSKIVWVLLGIQSRHFPNAIQAHNRCSNPKGPSTYTYRRQDLTRSEMTWDITVQDGEINLIRH
jgi:hypothetical protein